MESVKNPPKSEVYTAYQKRIVDVQKRLSKLQGTDVNSFEVRQLIGEYDFVIKQLYQLNDARTIMLEVAKCYQNNEEMIKDIDSIMGDGSAKYIGEAIEAFYTSPVCFK